jgi:kynurenine formamidase
MDCGDASNSIQVRASNHIGTHFDFPRHFIANGLTATDYSANAFVHDRVGLVWIDSEDGEIIDFNRLQKAGLLQIPTHVTLLLIRTGAEEYREQPRYRHAGPGLSPGLADELRNRFPHLTTIGLDSISLSSYCHRELGRASHREFLGKERPLLIIEDMSLKSLEGIAPRKVICLPLRIENADGAPCTVIACP